jgi:ATP-dependent protease ClpP protease subunit
MDELRLRMALQAQNLAQATHGKPWYQVRNAQDRAVINIYDEIGDLFGLSANEFVNDLRAINTPDIELHINSPGGIVFDGIAIYNALRQHPANVHVIVDSIAASIASVIAMAGDRIEMAQGSQMLIHDAHGACIGNASDMTQMSELLAKQSDNIANIYANRAGGDVADWRQRMQATTLYLAQEAVDAGLADGLLGDDADLAPMAAVWRPDMLNHVPVIANRAIEAWFRHVQAKASAAHHTDTENSSWDGPAAERNMQNDAATLKYCHAWSDPSGDPDKKSSYKFPHHRTKGGPANLAACRNGLARLSGADIDDKDGVEAHLRAHLRDGGAGSEDHHHEQVEGNSRLDWDPEAFKRAIKEGMSG